MNRIWYYRRGYALRRTVGMAQPKYRVEIAWLAVLYLCMAVSHPVDGFSQVELPSIKPPPHP